MSDGNSSTGQSYLDQATGLAQRAAGAITGNSSTQVNNTHQPKPHPSNNTNTP
jgi:uncharacterized protein YjbJ (UPF0337 family)